jgi:hypothetical protein
LSFLFDSVILTSAHGRGASTYSRIHRHWQREQFIIDVNHDCSSTPAMIQR